MKERSTFQPLNPALMVSVILLLVLGSIVVHSAVAGMEAGDAMFRRHFLGMAIGTVGLLIFWVFDYRKLHGWIGPLVLLDALLIISPKIPGLGGTAKGATLWLEIAGFRLFQPSEPAKILFILAIAGVIAQFRGCIEKPADVGRVLSVIALPMLLVVAVGDLGTGLVFAIIGAGMLLLGGLKGRWFLLLGITAVLLVGALFGMNEVLNRTLDRGNYDPAYLTATDKSTVDDTSVLIKRYQMNRLLVFIDPTRDPDGAGYNLEQSKIAIGSGGVSGKGVGSGTQSNLNFLPERHTDFIFSVLGEEMGFLGGVLLLGLYAVLLVSALGIATSSRDLYGSLVVAGVMSMWTFQVLENVGMTIGLMPITGIPLPFMSYGASSMVTNLAATGMLLSVWTRRYS